MAGPVDSWRGNWFGFRWFTIIIVATRHGWKKFTLFMILVFSIVCAFAYLLLILFQATYVGLYSRLMDQTSIESTTEPFQPTTCVVLCLRGLDPSLPDCLKGLAAQSYPDFQLICVVDDSNDPALDAVRQYSAQFQQPPKILVIDQAGFLRSLKCSALLTAFNHIVNAETAYEVIVLVDADTLCDDQWLRDLVAPMSNPEVDATSGNRWFEPCDDSIGSWVRQIWNAAAVVQMDLYGIPWGGSLAFRATLLEQTDFLKRLESAFCEDTLLSDVLRKDRRTLRSVRNLVVTNTESTTLPAATGFITRQLLTTRLYHWSWPCVMLHASSIFAINVVSLVALIIAICMAAWLPAMLLLAAFIGSQLANMALLGWIGRINHRKIEARPLAAQPTNLAGISQTKYFLAVMASPWVHAWATLCAVGQSKIHWRGIEYRITSQRVEMLEYKKYEPITPSNLSID